MACFGFDRMSMGLLSRGMVRQGFVVLTPGNGKCIMVKTIDNASNLFKKGKNIDGLTIG